MFQFKIEGIEELEQDIENKIKREDEFRDKAVEKTAYKLASEIRDNINRSSRTFKNWSKSELRQHYKDHVLIEKLEDGNYDVGPTEEISYRAAFLEYGTSKMAPKFPINSAVEQHGSGLVDEMLENYKRDMGL